MTMPLNDALALRDAAYETGVTDERMGRAAAPDDSAADVAVHDVEQITSALGHLTRVYRDRAVRLGNATTAGVTLAYEVERFLGDPEGVGTDTLREAYSLFMGRHSGGFTDSAMAGDASIDSGD